MAAKRAVGPFNEELPPLLHERGLSIRALARLVGIGDDHLSRVLRGDRGKRATAELTQRVALALELPEDYFAEVRLSFLVDRLTTDPGLRDDLYDRIRRRERRQSSHETSAAGRSPKEGSLAPRRRTHNRG